MHERSVAGIVSNYCTEYLRRILQASLLSHHRMVALNCLGNTDASTWSHFKGSHSCVTRAKIVLRILPHFTGADTGRKASRFFLSALHLDWLKTLKSAYNDYYGRHRLSRRRLSGIKPSSLRPLLGCSHIIPSSPLRGAVRLARFGLVS